MIGAALIGVALWSLGPIAYSIVGGVVLLTTLLWWWKDDFAGAYGLPWWAIIALAAWVGLVWPAAAWSMLP